MKKATEVISGLFGACLDARFGSNRVPDKRQAHGHQPPFLERLPGFFLLRVATPRSRLTR
jgi:hypothetical protein